jgi:hypothetical protein
MPVHSGRIADKWMDVFAPDDLIHYDMLCYARLATAGSATKTATPSVRTMMERVRDANREGWMEDYEKAADTMRHADGETHASGRTDDARQLGAWGPPDGLICKCRIHDAAQEPKLRVAVHCLRCTSTASADLSKQRRRDMHNVEVLYSHDA